MTLSMGTSYARPRRDR